MEQTLLDFYTHLNTAVRTTNGRFEETKFRKREKVDQFAYCGLNPMYRSYLSFDIDEPGWAFRYEDVNLPVPTIITVNPENAKCHMLYRLVTPVAFTKNARSGPQDYFLAVQREMGRRLGADVAYNHAITKNPLHPRWKVITNPLARYHLGDFLEYIELSGTQVAAPEDATYRGRNDQLFHSLLRWGYGAVRSFVDEEQWHRAVRGMADEMNAGFDNGLPGSELKSTARSVARWVWRHRHSPHKSRQRVLRFTDESPEDRMRMGAAHTNAIRREKSLDTLQTGFNTLRASIGDTVSVRQLVDHTGMNIKTVRKYYRQIVR